MVNLKDTELKQVQAQLEDLEETNLELTLEVQVKDKEEQGAQDLIDKVKEACRINKSCLEELASMQKIEEVTLKEKFQMEAQESINQQKIESMTAELVQLKDNQLEMEKQLEEDTETVDNQQRFSALQIWSQEIDNVVKEQNIRKEQQQRDQKDIDGYVDATDEMKEDYEDQLYELNGRFQEMDHMVKEKNKVIQNKWVMLKMLETQYKRQRLVWRIRENR